MRGIANKPKTGASSDKAPIQTAKRMYKIYDKPNTNLRILPLKEKGRANRLCFSNMVSSIASVGIVFEFMS